MKAVRLKIPFLLLLLSSLLDFPVPIANVIDGSYVLMKGKNAWISSKVEGYSNNFIYIYIGMKLM